MPNDGAAQHETAVRRSDWGLAGAFGLIGLVVTGTLVWVTRPGYLSFTDCVPYVLQAHLFSAGHLSRPAPEEGVSLFFTTVGMLQHEGREFSRQPPGASTAYALVAWLVRDPRWAPPVVTGLAAFLNFLWIRLIFDRRTAVLALLICLLGSTYVLIGASVLSYPVSALFFSAAMLLYAMALRRQAVRWALMCGVFVGLQFTVRPFTAVLTAAALGVCRVTLFRDRPRATAQALAFAAGLLPGVALLLIHNHLVTGAVWPLAFTLYGPADRLGFGVRGLGMVSLVHTPARAVDNLLTTVEQAVRFFFAPYVWLVPVVVWWAGRLVSHRRSDVGRLTAWDGTAIVLIVVPVVGHMAYWCPRTVNYFETYPLLTLLLARGVLYMVARGCLLRTLAGLVVVLLVGGAPLLTHIGLADGLAAVRRVHAAVKEARTQRGRLLVFTRPTDGKLGAPSEALLEYDQLCTDLFNRSLSPDEPVLYAVDRGPFNVVLTQRYPDRAPVVLMTRTKPGVEKGEALEVEIVPYAERLLETPDTSGVPRAHTSP